MIRRRSIRQSASPLAVPAAVCLLTLLAGGCTTSQYAKDADKSAYGTVAGGQKAVLGEKPGFDVTYRPFQPATRDGNASIRVGDKVIVLGPSEVQKLTLAECLEIGFRNSRDYQTNKETLYSAALDVWTARRAWNGTNFGGLVSGEASEYFTAKNSPQGVESGTASAGLTWAQNFIDGGVLALGATTSLASNLLGWNSSTVGSLLSANFTQPLMKNAWDGLAYEPQYRMERNFLFTVFNYVRYSQTLSTSMVTQYYSVLQARDQLENQKINIDRLRRTFEMTKVLVQGGQRSPVDRDQAEQAVLDSQVQYETQYQAYRDSLDAFKLTLGLPISAAVEVDYPAALDSLRQAGPKPFDMDEDKAVRTALSCRSDLLTSLAAARDARRNVDIAANQFLPEVDLALGISAPTTPGHNFTAIRFDRNTRSADLKFNYSLDQTANRDAYRKALLAMDKAQRDLDQFADTICLQVRQSYRALVQAKKTYDLQVRSVELSTRRAKLAHMEQVGGQASARDVLDAEESLRVAQNGLTSALISYETTRLGFLASLGLIAVDEKGQPRELQQPQTFSRLVGMYPYVLPPGSPAKK